MKTPMTTPHAPSDEKEVKKFYDKVFPYNNISPTWHESYIIKEALSQLAAKDKEIERLQKFHVEDMRVTNESATFHMKLCEEQRHELTTLRAQLATMQEAVRGLEDENNRLKKL